MISWLVKDLAWVLLCGEVTHPAAAAALCLELGCVAWRWGAESTVMRVHSLAVLVWLLGNVMWMTLEFRALPSQVGWFAFPWYHGPVTSSQKYYDARLVYAQGVFVFGLALLGCLYAWCGLGYLRGRLAARTPEQQSQPPGEAGGSAEGLAAPSYRKLVWGVMSKEVYLCLFIGPWLLKDFFWTLEMYRPSILCGLAVVLLLVKNVKVGGPAYLAELAWVMGNLIWLSAESLLGDGYCWPRLLAALALATGIVFVVVTFNPVERSEARGLLEVKPCYT